MGYFLLLCIEFDRLLLIKKQIGLKVMSFRECHSISSVKLNCHALDVLWLVKSLQSKDKRQSWHYKWKVCSGYCIDHAKFKIFQVSKPLILVVSLNVCRNSKWLNTCKKCKFKQLLNMVLHDIMLDLIQLLLVILWEGNLEVNLSLLIGSLVPDSHKINKFSLSAI